MNEIADEFERVAEEFEAKCDEHAALEARYRDDPGAFDSETLHAASADTWKAASVRLRKRAAELRAQRSGSARNAQPIKRPVLVYDDRSIDPHRKR